MSIFVRLVFLIFTFATVTSPANAQVGISADSGVSKNESGFMGGFSFFFFQDESSLGENTLNEGSSTFKRVDLQYNFVNYFSGVGVFYESNSFGEDQEDTSLGLIFEALAGNFFLNYLHGLQVEQKFENRSFSSRKGYLSAIEFGIRAPLLFGFSYYEFKVHNRTLSIIKEDGRKMDSQYTLSQTMPMLAIGVKL